MILTALQPWQPCDILDIEAMIGVRRILIPLQERPQELYREDYMRRRRYREEELCSVWAESVLGRGEVTRNY